MDEINHLNEKDICMIRMNLVELWFSLTMPISKHSVNCKIELNEYKRIGDFLRGLSKFKFSTT